MKKLSRLYKWIALAVLFQVAVLSYMEFIYLPNRGAVTATSFEPGKTAVKSKSMKLPGDAQGVLVSFNGVHAAYMQGEKLVVADIDRGGKVLKTLEAAGGKFGYYRWLPDRDMLIYSITEPEGKKGQVLVSTLDLGPMLERSYPKMTGLPHGSAVTDIELSPLTNIVYTMVKTSETAIKVYKYNIMDDLTYVMKANTEAVFKETSYTDNLIYQDKGGKITIRNGTTAKKTYLPVKGTMKLLAVDAEDNIYAGQLNDGGKVIKVHYGRSDQTAKEWKETELKGAFEVSELAVTPDGSIYTIAEKDNFIQDTATGNKFSYEGSLIEILDDYIISIDGQKLRLTAIVKSEQN